MVCDRRSSRRDVQYRATTRAARAHDHNSDRIGSFLGRRGAHHPFRDGHSPPVTISQLGFPKCFSRSDFTRRRASNATRVVSERACVCAPGGSRASSLRPDITLCCCGDWVRHRREFGMLFAMLQGGSHGSLGCTENLNTLCAT